MNEEQTGALERFAALNGRKWKAKLRTAWERSSYSGAAKQDAEILQGLRNAADFGPAGLVKYRLRSVTGPLIMERGTVELPGVVASAACWLMVPRQNWMTFAVPYFDDAQLLALRERLDEMSIWILRDGNHVEVRGEALEQSEVVERLESGGQSFWKLGQKWPWVEKSAVGDLRPNKWVSAVHTHGEVVVIPCESGWELWHVSRSKRIAWVATLGDAERMAAMWNQAVTVSNIQLSNGVLELAWRHAVSEANKVEGD